jgi:hypothetical protein
MVAAMTLANASKSVFLCVVTVCIIGDYIGLAAKSQEKGRATALPYRI